MTTYTDSTTNYSIDQVSSGLSFTFGCNLPCATCRDDDPDYCLSCNQWNPDQFLILDDGVCRVDCPATKYRIAFDCYKCDDRCLTCDQYSGSLCTSCNNVSNFPFLYGNTCVDTCIHGFYGNFNDASCQTCVDPCETCIDSPDKCLSCKLPPPGEPIHQFYFEH